MQMQNSGRHDLLRAARDGGDDVLAHLFHVTVDVLDRHGRVVDENADGERQPHRI